jgi:predicted HNH restriction endonuclease
MPYKDPEKSKAYHKVYHKKWYEKNKRRHKNTSNANRRRKRTEFNTYKTTLACVICGVKHPAVIDFHHVVRTNKKNVSKLVRNNAFSQLRKELKKCIPLCSNCHRILHYEETFKKKKRKKGIVAITIPRVTTAQK